MHFSALFARKKTVNNKQTSNSPTTRLTRIELLEDRSLLSAAAIFASTPLAQFSQVEPRDASAYTEEFSNAQDDQIQAEAEVDAKLPVAQAERYDIEYDLLEEGNVRVLGQTGLQKVSTMSYCAIPDRIYLDLWERAIERWESVITVGAEDVEYPYAVDGTTGVQVDDLYLYLGFSDSFSTSTSLGSSLNAGYYRDNGRGLAATGSLVFNAKYFTANPDENVQTVFYNTALHEMGHSMGYNVNHFKALGLIESLTDVPYGLNDVFTDNSSYWYYVGEKGVDRYLSTFPENFTSKESPDRYLMETYTASGSYGAHLSSVLGTYYSYLNQRDGMSYSISPNFDATLTPTTLGVLEDLGYTVDYDFADVYGSSAPENLEAVAYGKTVVLNWDQSAGDLSNSVSGPAHYTVERLNTRPSMRGQEASWEVVATDVSGLQYIDSTVEANGEYTYRVRATNIRTNDDVGVFRAKSGDVLSWDYDADKFTIYALVNVGSDALGWTRVENSISAKSWTVKTLAQTPKNGETLFHVVAVGITKDVTTPSRAADVSIWTNAANYVPDGYSAQDWNAIKRFLELEDADGVKNGTKVAGASYSPDLLEELDGATWEEIDGERRLTRLVWNSLNLVGDLDLLGCDELERVSVADNNLDSIELDSFNLTILNVDDCGLNSLDVSKLVALESLSCARNSLEELDVSSNLRLIYLNCDDNALEELSLVDNWNLTTLSCSNNSLSSISLIKNAKLAGVSCWNDSLSSIYLPAGFAGTVDLGKANADDYRWINGSEEVGNSSRYAFDGSDSTRTARILQGDSQQIVVCYVGSSWFEPAAPTNLSFGTYNSGNVEMTWTDEAVGEIGYKVFYQIDGSVWKLAETLFSDATTSESSGTTISRIAKRVEEGRAYGFRIVAYTIDPYGMEHESQALTGEYKHDALDAPSNFVAYDYNGDAMTLSLAWDAVSDAAQYEVQYRRSNDDGATWSTGWKTAEVVSSLGRTAVGVHENALYEFRLRSINSVGEYSQWTTTSFQSLPTLEAPTFFETGGYSPSAQTLALTWSPVSSATRFECQYRSASNEADLSRSNWNAVGDVTETSRTATRVAPGRYYEFRVRARNDAGERSEWVALSFFHDEGQSTALNALDRLFESYVDGESF